MNVLYLNQRIRSSFTFPKYGFNNFDDLINCVIDKINNQYKKIKIDSVEYVQSSNIFGVQIQATYFGFIKSDRVLGYVCLTPYSCARNGFISQQLMPGLLPLYNVNKNDSFNISNLPVFIFDFLEENHKRSQLLSILNYKLSGCIYFDMISNRNIENELINKGIPKKFSSLKQFNELLVSISRSNPKCNDMFTMDETNKKIIISKKQFKARDYDYFMGLTNEPYYFCNKLFLMLELALVEEWTIDLSEFDSYNNGTNANVDIILKYLKNILKNGGKGMQKIYYGAPGTGKSYSIEEQLSSVSEDRIFRVTFYPDYMYSDFIGQLIPVKKETGFEYDFVEGDFLKAIKKAYENLHEDVYVVIEELSRGKAPAIFGDTFQLLDRIKVGLNKGYSRYGITNQIISDRIPTLPSNKVKLPPNLHILATLNVCDQNVYPLDTAFKRRFDWEYINTDPVSDENGNLKNNFEFEIKVLDGNMKSIKWCDFYQVLNKFIVSKDYLELGEDKQIGQFFIETNTITKKEFANKVLFYLWNDIALSSYKTNVFLFDKIIDSFGDLYKKYLNDDVIFSEDFLDLL